MTILTRKLLRDIWRARGQSFAIAMLVCAGTSEYVGVASVQRNLQLTRDEYYADCRMADFFISLARAPRSVADDLREIPGVRNVQGRIVKDVNLGIEGYEESRTGRIISLPDVRAPVINDIVLITGRYFEHRSTSEIILSHAFATANKLKIGDTITASINNRQHTLHIVGTGMSPEYVYMIRSAQELIPNPDRFGVLWVSQTFAEQSFAMQGACNDFVGTVERPAEIDRILNTASSVLAPYGVFAKTNRKDQTSSFFLANEIRVLGIATAIIPPIFMGVTALVLVVLLNRMVRHERTQIGVMKAFGYSDASVAAHYVWFALVLGLAGCLAGYFGGVLVVKWVMQIYIRVFQFPTFRMDIYPIIMLQSAVLTMVCAAAGAFGAARQAARIEPAIAIRAEAPKYSRRIFLERFNLIWGSLSFSSKMIARNMARYKFRAVFTLSGVAMSTAMLLMGWFLMDAVIYMIDFQFSQTQLEDVRVLLNGEQGKDTYHDLQRLSDVKAVEPVLQYPFEARTNWRKKEIAIVGIPAQSTLWRLIDTQGNRVEIDKHDFVLDERLAEQLGVQPGDELVLKPLMGRVPKERRVHVTKIVKQYLGMGSYMEIEALSRVLDEPFAMNTALVRSEWQRARELDKSLRDVAAIASVRIKEDSHANLKKSLGESMRAVNVIILGFAAAIAFAIIYNSTIVSLTERHRELAALRVMGYLPSEVGRLIYNENLLLSAIGFVVGIPLGIGLCGLIVMAYENDLFRLPFKIGLRAYALTILTTFCFVTVANLAARRKILQLDMVEALKMRD